MPRRITFVYAARINVMKLMKQNLLYICIMLVVLGCRSKKNIPDVSGINISLQTERFEKDFFSLDTLQLNSSLQKLYEKYPGFTQDYLFNILGSSADSATKEVTLFLRSYTGMYRASLGKFEQFNSVEKEVVRGLQFVKYYFPQYPLPKKLITFIGPINSYGNIITPNALAVGLQLSMGRDYPLYLSAEGQQLYPQFISRKFEPAYIPVNCIRNIIDDMYPDKSMGKPLIEQMVEAGKRIYLLDRLLPELPDTLKTGYTEQQLKGCYESEKNIWSFFVQNDLLYNSDPNLTRDYMADGPNTAAFGDASPGNIGQFVGWRIINKWMEKHQYLPPDALMNMPAKQIFEEARYKPK